MTRDAVTAAPREFVLPRAAPHADVPVRLDGGVRVKVRCVTEDGEPWTWGAMAVLPGEPVKDSPVSRRFELGDDGTCEVVLPPGLYTLHAWQRRGTRHFRPRRRALTTTWIHPGALTEVFLLDDR